MFYIFPIVGAGLKCYTCGWWNKNCGDPFVKDDYLLVECNTRAINDFNHELGNTVNTVNTALQNFANQVGFNFNQNSNNNFNLPTISEDSVGCSKVVLKRMYYNNYLTRALLFVIRGSFNPSNQYISYSYYIL